MGVETRLVLFAADSAAARSGAEAAFARIAELDSLMSDYRLDSELSRVNGAAGGGPLRVSDDMVRVLATALDVSARTGGAFDITVGPVVALWREARRTGTDPDPDALARARQLVDWKRVRLDPRAGTLALDAAGMRLDLGAVAKGHAAAAARAVLASRGIGRCLVELGGELALGAAPPGRTGWSVELGAGSASARTVELEHTVVATSGDAEQYVVIDGVRYSHVIEPATGRGSRRGVSATVIGPDGALADALATAATLLDAEARQRLSGAYPAYTFIVDDPDG